MARRRRRGWAWVAGGLIGCGGGAAEPPDSAVYPAGGVAARVPRATPSPTVAAPAAAREPAWPLVASEPASDPLAALDAPATYPARTVALRVTAESWREDGPLDLRAAIEQQLASVGITVVPAGGAKVPVVVIGLDETRGAKMQAWGGFASGETGEATDVGLQCEVRRGDADEPLAGTAVSVEARAGDSVSVRGDLETSLALHARDALREAPGFRNLGLFVAATLGDRAALRRLLAQHAGGDAGVALADLVERPDLAPASALDRALLALWNDDLAACAAAGPEGRALLVRELLAQDLSTDQLGFGDTDPVLEVGRRLAAVASALAATPEAAAARGLAQALAAVPRPAPAGVPSYSDGAADPGGQPDMAEARDGASVALLSALGRVGSPFELAAVAPLRDDPVQAVAAEASTAARAIIARAWPHAAGASPPTVHLSVHGTAAEARRFDVGREIGGQCIAAGLRTGPADGSPADVVAIVDYYECTPVPGAGGATGIGLVLCVAKPGTDVVVGPFVVAVAAPGTQAEAIAGLVADPRFAALGRFVAAAFGNRVAQEALWPHVFEWDLAHALTRCVGAAEPEAPALAAWWRLARGDVGRCVALGAAGREAFAAYAAWAAVRPAPAARIADEARLATAMGTATALPLLHARLALLPSLNELSGLVYHTGDSDADAVALATLVDALAALTPPGDRPVLLARLREYVIDQRGPIAATARAACGALGGDPAAIERELRKEIDERDNPPEDEGGMGEGEGGADGEGGDDGGG